MKRLCHLQDKFQNYLLQGNSDFQNLIVSTEKVSVETRLGIYSNAYKSRLIEALASNYPVLNGYVGDTIFEKIASEYINQFPSCFRSIRWFGDSLSEFLHHHHEYKELPYLSELSRFEWLQTLVFDAADRPVLQLKEVAQIHPESWAAMRLCAHPSLHRVDLSWNVVQIWQAVAEDQTPNEPIKGPCEPWILWRKELMNRFCSLTESEAWAIDAVFKKLTFGEICVGLCHWMSEEEAGSYAASLLRGWIASGLLAEVRL